MAVGADGSFQLDGAGHASVLKGEVGILLFGVWKGAAGTQKVCVNEDRERASLPVPVEQLQKPNLALHAMVDKGFGNFSASVDPHVC